MSTGACGMSRRSQSHDSPSKIWAYPAPRKQHPLHQETLLSAAPVRQGLIDQSIIRPCQSSCNTLILSEKFNGKIRWYRTSGQSEKPPRLYTNSPYCLHIAGHSTVHQALVFYIRLKRCLLLIPLAQNHKKFCF